jgi:hypothetical protein
MLIYLLYSSFQSVRFTGIAQAAKVQSKARGYVKKTGRLGDDKKPQKEHKDKPRERELEDKLGEKKDE